MVKSNNKQKLIKATDNLLKDKSIASVTTKEITKAAGVSVGVFYNYFNSKEDIFTEVIKTFYNYSLQQMEGFRLNITGKNIRSEVKFKEFLIRGIDLNWENHFLSSDILLVSRSDENFKKMMMDFNDKMVDIVVEVLMRIHPEYKDCSQIAKAKLIINLIQNSYPVFCEFQSEEEKEEYIKQFVNTIFEISYNN